MAALKPYPADPHRMTSEELEPHLTGPLEPQQRHSKGFTRHHNGLPEATRKAVEELHTGGPGPVDPLYAQFAKHPEKDANGVTIREDED